LLAVILLVSAISENPLHAAERGGNGTSVIVAYIHGASSEDITYIEEKYGLQFVKTLAAADSRVYRVPPPKSLEQTLRDLGTERVVRYAEVDQEVTVQEEK
jgi:hypothetical protein